jgi:hypothetical protein
MANEWEIQGLLRREAAVLSIEDGLQPTDYIHMSQDLATAP